MTYFTYLFIYLFLIDYRDILNENNETDINELDTEKFVPIAVECLAILFKLNDTIEVSINNFILIYLIHIH